MKIRNKLYLFIVITVFPIIGHTQIANYNHFPTMKPLHILDSNLNNISFAFGMRVLESDYNGPLIRLRRSSDNTEKDFGWGDNDKIDIDAIDTWRSGSDVYVHTWYDQSGLSRDAIQIEMAKQPQFSPDITRPHFKGDGSNDHLTVDTPNGIQDVTNSGKQGTVFAIMSATSRAQHSFGVLTGGDRWSTHVNWSNNSLYFDPGGTGSPRSFGNSDNANKWVHYTFLKNSTRGVVRVNGIEKLNGSNDKTCTRTEDFAIGWATGNQASYHATTSFMEMIMYKTDITTTEYQEIENNAITFWGI